mmetsp:Transcript_40180/g.65116  ORF Transcript_40180/g.65116 Transcript_40180/m.65116 type:complete len:85 (+) Transcript_40180:425-679(+)
MENKLFAKFYIQPAFQHFDWMPDYGLQLNGELYERSKKKMMLHDGPPGPEPVVTLSQTSHCGMPKTDEMWNASQLPTTQIAFCC